MMTGFGLVEQDIICRQGKVLFEICVPSKY